MGQSVCGLSLRNREDWFGSTIEFIPDVLTWVHESSNLCENTRAV